MENQDALHRGQTNIDQIIINKPSALLYYLVSSSGGSCSENCQTDTTVFMGWECGKKALPLVAWDVIQLPKNLGGLSIGNIKHKNLALLFKWLWRFFEEPSLLWCQVIRAKYKYPPTLTLSDLSIPNSGGPWKHVCSSILRNQEASKIALKGVRKNVKNGKASLFWHDTWLGETAL